MKRKIFAICAAVVFGVMSAGTLFACDNTPAPMPHVCGHVCPEDGCGKCLDATCTDPVCADKCEGHTPAPAEHECKDECPECGKCTSDCTDPACTDKCPGHTPAPVKYGVTFDLDGGDGTVETASYAAGETFALPTADGFSKGVCTLAGWNDGTDDYEPGAQYEMPEDDVTFTALWQAAEYTFAVVDDGVQNDNVILKPGSNGFNLNGDHIGGVAGNVNAAMVFDVQADKAGSAKLYFTVCDRQGEFTFDDAYTLTVNGAVVHSSADMSKGGTDWNHFESYEIADLELVAGKNRIVITVLGDSDIAGNVKGITLTSETVACTPYVDPAWTNETVFDALDGSALRSGVRSNGNPSGAENCIGAMEWEGNFVAFRVESDTACRAAAYINVCHRSASRGLCDAFELYIDGKPVTCYSLMPSGGTQWTDYDYVKLDDIDLPANRPIEITVVSKGGDSSAYNVRGLKLVTEQAQNISLTAGDLYGYASAWNTEDIKFVTEADGNKTLTPGVTTGGGVSIDGASAALGNISGNAGATVSFTVSASADTRAVLSLGASLREYYFHKAYELKVNGKTVFSSSAMPAGDSWSTFEYVALAAIELSEGDNEISITVISSENWMGSNLEGVTIQYESGSVSLKS